MMKSLLKCYGQTFQKRGATRGVGMLERFLALQRVRLVKRLLRRKNCLMIENLVDIGCGAYPLFLLTSRAKRRYGLDRIDHLKSAVRRRIRFIPFDAEQSDPLPFEKAGTDVISLLAVFEHIPHSSLEYLFREIHRCLKPSGFCVVTTPAVWSDVILRILARLNLVSSEEIDEHRDPLDTSEILRMFRRGGFTRIENGYFEVFLNRWFLLEKD